MKKIKKACNIVIAVGLCAASAVNAAAPVYASDALATKDENIYATLNSDGSVSGIYVINEFFSETGGEISDYGEYTSVQNLTDQSDIILEDGHITATMPQGQFYYQGNLDSQKLPWDISIRYYLDGAELQADELAGKSGKLRIIIETKKNPDCDELFFDNYILQATVVLNTEKCADIQAEGATEGNVGVNRQLVYTILPEEETEIEITAQVQEFEMEGITFQGVPLSLSLSEDMLDEMSLTDQTQELADAVALLDDGVGELKEGTKAAADGGLQLAEGIRQLAKGTGALKSGGDALTDGTSQLYGGTKELKEGVNQYTAGVESFASGVEQYVAGVELLAQGSRQLAPLEDLPLIDAAVSQLYQAVAAENGQQGGVSLQAGAESLTQGLNLILQQVRLLESSTDAEQMQEMLEALNQLAAMTSQLSGALEEIGEAVGGSAEMVRKVESSNQQVMAEINRQVEAANSEIAVSVNSANDQIDRAVAAVQAAVEAGTLDEESASQTIAGLKAAKLDPDTAASVQMPQENNEIQGIIDELEGVSETLKNAAEEFAKASAQMKTAAEGMASGLPASGTEGIAGLSQALSAVCEGAENLNAGIGAVGDALQQLGSSTASFGEAADGIAALNAGIDELCKNNSLLLDGSEALTGAGEELAAGVSALTSGTAELNSGAGTLAEGIDTLDQGASLLDDNTDVLISGLHELDKGTGKLKEGTQRFRQETDHMDEKIQEEIESLMEELGDEDFEPVSFLSEKNTNIGLVQFAITTDGITIPEETQEPEPEEEEGFGERLLKLFQ